MDNIALAFSGGGFRAAGYSLGALAYLNQVTYKGDPLLKNVKFISSTSGGSITNLVYSTMLFEKGDSDFAGFFNSFSSQLDGELLLGKAMEKLKKKSAWKTRPHKTRNLINAFSMVYDELLQQKTLSFFSDRKNNPHLEEICITSTEFTNGISFLFPSHHPDTNFPRGKIGNGYINFKRNSTEGGKLKLADILASSSCFPSGFEPLIFPEDYAYDQLTPRQLRDAVNYKANTFTLSDDKDEDPGSSGKNSESIEKDRYNSYDFGEDEEFKKDIRFGIMDGGVADNQAIDAFKKADQRRRDKNMPQFDLFISCDVGSYTLDGYTLPLQKKNWYDFLSIRTLIRLKWLLFMVFPAIFILSHFNVIQWNGIAYIATTISALVFIPIVLSRIKGLFSKKKKATSWSITFGKYKGVLFGLKLGILEQMITSRLKSVFIMANDIYLNKIRRMYYDELFSDNKYRDRSIQNTIYDLSRVNFENAENPAAELDPSPQMIDAAEKARTMATTLWFDGNHQEQKVKDCIIATGQFTTCYNLLRHIRKIKTPDEETKKLEAVLLNDYNQFKENPFFLMEKLAKSE